MCALQDQSDVVPDAHRHQADVDVAERDREEADERPLHVPAIEAARAIVCDFAGVTASQLVLMTADDMAHGVAAERVAGEEDDIGGEDDRAEPDAELCPATRGREPHCLPDIPRKDEQEDHRYI